MPLLGELLLFALTAALFSIKILPMDLVKSEVREYLLDTSIWRALCKHDFEQLASQSARFRPTSGIVVPFELISGIPSPGDPKLASEFAKRRAALRRLLEFVSPGSLDLRTPHQILSSAFGVSVDPTGTDFLILMQLLAKAETPDEFYLLVSKASSLSKQMPTPNWLRKQADRVSGAFPASVAESAALMRQATEASLIERGIVDKDMRKLRRGFIPYLHHVGDLKRYVFLAVASRVGVSATPPDSKLLDWTVAEYERLRGKYDGSIDVYLDVYERFIGIALNGKDAGHNDPFDLDNLVYLRSGDTTQLFVTDDKKLYDLAAESLHDRILDLAGFRRIIA